jgi:hypothetical protein
MLNNPYTQPPKRQGRLVQFSNKFKGGLSVLHYSKLIAGSYQRVFNVILLLLLIGAFWKMRDMDQRM